MNQVMEDPPRNGLEIAIIGMAGRFPGAQNIDEFWDNIVNGRESIWFFTEEELERAGIDPQLTGNPQYVKAKGVLEEIHYFDSFFFDYTPGEAGIMDPQVRIFHECAWDALSHAGYDPYTYEGFIGLYAGMAYNTFWMGQLTAGFKGQHRQLEAGILNDRDFFATRMAYKLHLKGPALTIQTACSTSLAAFHLACQALVSGECSIALAGGVSVVLPQKSGYLYQEGMLHSPTGHCRAFDARANGTIFGDGVGLVVLKSLEEAREHGDCIYALVKGSALNNDGSDRVGYTAPGTSGQVTVIRLAHSLAEVEPGSIGYVETHGTGTIMGDPIEIQALKMAFNTTKKGFCAVGSVKTNVGHLNTAAGITGLIKTVLALARKKIPPSLGFETPNPGIDFENSPFYVNTQLKEWESPGYPRRAAVSSFGIGGTNSHVILEEAPAETRDKEGTRGLAPLPDGEVPCQARGEVFPPEKSGEYHLILLSAKTQSSLDKMTKNLAQYFKKNPGINLAEAAYTLQVGRSAFQFRKFLVTSTAKETADGLMDPNYGTVVEGVAKENPPRLVFMFPGQGSQYVNMGLDLYKTQPVLREEMDHCFKIINTLTNYNLKEILYPGERKAQSAERKANKRHALCAVRNAIDQTEIAQPLLFTFEYALAKLLMRWGIKPDAMIGHSIGEYTAACLSGVFSLEDALKLVALRGKLMQRMPFGAMLSVTLSEEALIPLLKLNENLSLAAVNSSHHCVVSGPSHDIEAFANQLKEKRVTSKPLHISHAFHSSMMDPLLQEFAAGFKQVRVNTPTIPYISNITGKMVTVEELVNPGYWGCHLRNTVRFNDGIAQLLEDDNLIFLEVGPGNTLGTFVNQHCHKKPGQPVMNLVRHPQEEVTDDYYLLGKIGVLWLYGVSIDWTGFYAGEKRYRVSLPGYPFEKRPYSIENLPLETFSEMTLSLPEKNKDTADWFYIPSWEHSVLVPGKHQPMVEKPGFLVFVDTCSLGTDLVKQLKSQGHDVITVKKGLSFTKLEENGYKINPGQPGDYEKLFNELCLKDRVPGTFLHLWGISEQESKEAAIGVEAVKDSLNSGFYSLLYIARAIAAQCVPYRIFIEVVTTGIFVVTGAEVSYPARAAVLGPVKVIPQEYPTLRCRLFDIDLPGSELLKTVLIHRLISEFLARSFEPIIAYRNNYRWVQNMKPLRLEETEEKTTMLREGGVYLITGGLGGIGLVLAQDLASRVGVNLVLTGVSPFPAREEWEEWLISTDKDPRVCNKIKKLLEIEKMGSQVMAVSADVSHLEQMEKVFTAAEKKFGKINGVIHSAGRLGETMFRTIEEISKTDCQRQFKPKLYGSLVLARLLQDRDVDFCLLMSSTSAILGGLGLAAYSAANSCMDALSHQHHKIPTTTHWISVNWDGWQVGEDNKQEQAGSLGQRVVELSMTPAEGVKAFQRILSFLGTAQIIQSTGDLQTRIHQWVKREFLDEEDTVPGEKPDTQAERPLLQVPYAAPRTREEQVLARLWRKQLGYERVGIRDNFFELGGDSLKATILAAKIYKELNAKIPLAKIFETPTIRGLAQYIRHFREDQFVAIEAAEKKEYYFLSSGQRRLYILQQLAVDSTHYNLPRMFSFDGIVDRERLEKTIKKLINRHESLRTSFETLDRKPIQRIRGELELKIDYYEAESKDKSPGLPLTSENIIHHFIRPFDLSEPPLLRVGLIKTGNERHILGIDMHHIISDWVSMDLILEHFTVLYENKRIPSLRIQYKDYAEWQDRERQKETINQQEKYWLSQFPEEIPVLNLPYDYDRPPIQNFEGSVVDFSIDNKQYDSLKEMAEEHDVTLYMILLAVFNILLSKLSGREDIIVGTPVAGRRHPDLQQLVGFFVNTLALRNYPAPGKTFNGFLKEIKDRTLAAFENQDYPFEALVEKLTVNINRDNGRHPLIDVVFTLENIDMIGIKIPGLTLEPLHHEISKSKFDMILSARKNEKKLNFRMTYCSKLFKTATIKGFIRCFQEILSLVVKNKETRLQDIRVTYKSLKTRGNVPQISFKF